MASLARRARWAGETVPEPLIRLSAGIESAGIESAGIESAGIESAGIESAGDLIADIGKSLEAAG